MRRFVHAPKLVTAAALALSAAAGLPAHLSSAHSLAKRPFPVTVIDDLHNHVTITKQPQRILSLDPRDTETLFALGLEKRVVGDGTFEGAAGINRNFRYPAEWPSRWGRDYPIKAKLLPHMTGGCCGTDFNLEAIKELRPDLVLTFNSATEQPIYQRMRDAGITLLILDPSSISGILHDISLVGRATGASSHAAAVIKTMRAQLATVRARLAHVRSRPRVYYEIDATNPAQPITAGPGTFIDQAIRLAQGRNIAQGVTSCSGTLCYPAFSLEALVSLNPQIILLGDAAYGTTPESVKSRSGWSSISAVQSGRIYPFDDELISRAGPRIMVGLRKLAALIHPAAFGR